MSPPALTGLDVDGDHMCDAWETRYGVDDAQGDPDGDTVPNLDEYQAGTDPQRCLRRPVVRGR